MMKHIFTIAILLLAALTTACNKPKVIPDKQLGQIFRDAMLVNSYLSIKDGTKTDSMRIYEPIFASYGYTAEDVQYTIHNFSQRKSANLSDVAEYMILLLDREANALNLQVAKLDTIENVARRRYTQTILDKKDISIRKEADSSLMRFIIEPIQAGNYHINASYTLDSLDKSSGRRYRIYFEREDSTTRIFANGYIYRRKESNFEHRVDVDEEATTYKRLVVEMSHFADKKLQKPTKMQIHNITIKHTPPTEECVERLFHDQSGVRIFSDSLIHAIEEGAQR